MTRPTLPLPTGVLSSALETPAQTLLGAPGGQCMKAPQPERPTRVHIIVSGRSMAVLSPSTPHCTRGQNDGSGVEVAQNEKNSTPSSTLFRGNRVPCWSDENDHQQAWVIAGLESTRHKPRMGGLTATTVLATCTLFLASPLSFSWGFVVQHPAVVRAPSLQRIGTSRHAQDAIGSHGGQNLLPGHGKAIFSRLAMSDKQVRLCTCPQLRLCQD